MDANVWTLRSQSFLNCDKAKHLFSRKYNFSSNPKIIHRSLRSIHGERALKYSRERTTLPSCSNNQRDVFFSEASSMTQLYDALADRILESAHSIEEGNKFFIAVAGPPGAGKSTVARQVVQRANDKWRDRTNEEEDLAVDVPMDGFHLYRKQLDQFDDPKEAHARRGAPWTFDPVSLAQHLSAIKSNGSGHLPSFDHGVGDPVPDDIFVEPSARVVVVEGNYLLLDEPGWQDLHPLFDDKWYIDVDLMEAMERVEERHKRTGKSPEIAKWRVWYNDKPNAELVMATMGRADIIIRSIRETI